MPRRPTRRVPTVLIPGLDGSGPGHWQVWLAAELQTAGREAVLVEFPDSAAPLLQPWLAALRAVLVELDEDGFDLVAHSLGALLWMHSAASGLNYPRPARVALVAPPGPEIPVPQCEQFFPVPLNIEAMRKAANGTVLVGSDNDPFCPRGIAASYGAPLKMATTVIPDAGHLNIDSGHGPWPAMLDWCGRDNLAFIG